MSFTVYIDNFYFYFNPIQTWSTKGRQSKKCPTSKCCSRQTPKYTYITYPLPYSNKYGDSAQTPIDKGDPWGTSLQQGWSEPSGECRSYHWNAVRSWEWTSYGNVGGCKPVDDVYQKCPEGHPQVRLRSIWESKSNHSPQSSPWNLEESDLLFTIYHITSLLE